MSYYAIMTNDRQKTLTDRTEQRIYEYIRARGFRFGDLLPKEEELAAELNVSRTITREALSRLKAAGVIESRRRRGMILKKPDIFAGLDKLIHSGMLDDETRGDLAQLRLVIELGLADLIYRNRHEKALKRLENTARKFAEQVTTAAAHGKIEQLFHRRLFALSGNQLITRFQMLLEPFYAPSRNWTPALSRLSCRDHLALVNVLRTGTPAEWREELHKHFRVYLNCPEPGSEGGTGRPADRSDGGTIVSASGEKE